MNSRERLLAALRCQPVDRIPWCPLVDGYLMLSVDEPHRGMDEWEFLADIGADLWIRRQGGVRYEPSLHHHAEPGEWQGIRLDVEKTSTGRVNTYTTPVGTLREEYIFTSESPNIPFPVEHKLKTAEDVETWTYIVERTRVMPDFAKLERAARVVGDRGLVCASAPWSPVMGLVMFDAGVESFYYLLADHTAKVERLMAATHEVYKEAMRVLGGAPAEAIITYENTSTSLASPDVMRRYEFPALDEYAELVHASGKLYLIHMCGKVQRALDLIARARFDGVVDIAVPPTGDCDLARARAKLAAAGKSLAGGIDATAFVGLSPEQMEEHVASLLQSVAPGTGFVLDSGDAVPFGTPLENLRAASRAVEKYGKYPLSS